MVNTESARLPPHSIEAEEGVLACILSATNGEAQEIMANLSDAGFYGTATKKIFRRLAELEFDNLSLDVPTLYERLKSHHELDDVGGLDYLQTLPDKTPSAASSSSFLATIKDLEHRRTRLAQISKEESELFDLTVPFGSGGDDDAAVLAARTFDFRRQPPKVEPVFTLCGNSICTVGNLTSIVSQAKTGKSAVIGAMLAATMAPDDGKQDLLGFKSENPWGRAVIHVDTEQSLEDFWQGVARSIRRAGLSSPPEWLLAYCLTGLLPRDAWQRIRRIVKRAADKFGGVHSVLIDGVGDLVHDVNDAGECTDFVATLHGLAIEHECPNIGVLHFNPDTAKARGHLGSQLERKSESNLRLDREEEYTVLWSNKQRRASITKDFGPRFTWSDEAGMHVTVENRSDARRGVRAETEIPFRDDAFNGRPAMRYNELISAIETTVKCSHRTAERRASKWVKLAVIAKDVAGLWIPKD